MEKFKTIEECKQWLKNNDVNKLDEYNQNILFYQRDLEIIKYLIENTDINVNQLDKYNQNILFYQKNLETNKYLIENTDIDIKNYLYNENAFYYHNYYRYIRMFYEARELEKELNKITSIKEDKEKVKKI